MTTKPEWIFKELSPNDDLENPNENQLVKDQPKLDALIRESIQNSMDAQFDKELPLEIVIRLSSTEDEFDLRQTDWLKGLKQHVEAEQNDIRFTDLPSKCSFIVIEDFNTYGLRGDPDDHKGVLKNNANFAPDDWNAFWKGRGVTQKSGSKLGSWGIGKTVFPASSKIRTFFGLTIRQDDDSITNLLFGKSIQQVHTIGEDEKLKAYKANGYFCFPYEDNEPQTPIDDEEIIHFFKETFNLSRTTEAGLSVVVPYLSLEHDDYQSISLSVIEHFAFPLLRGKLIVRVIRGDNEMLISNTQVENILASSLLNENLDPKLVHKLRREVELIRSIFSYDYNNFMGHMFEVNQFQPNNVKEMPWPDTESRKNMMSHFKNGKPLKFTVPVQIETWKNGTYIDNFQMIFTQISTKDEGGIAFYREGLRISDVNAKGRNALGGKRGLLALVTVDSSSLTNFDLANALRASETPSHRDWTPDQDKLLKLFKNGKEIVGFVKAFPKVVYMWMMNSDEEPDAELLSDLLPVPVKPDTPTQNEFVDPSGDNGPDSGDGPLNPPDDIQPEEDSSTEEPQGTKESGSGTSSEVDGTNKRYEIQPAANGIQVSSLPNYNGLPLQGAIFELEFRYVGKAYHPLDFDLSKKGEFTISHNGTCKVHLRKDNFLIFEVIDMPFVLSLVGFDPNRDLNVKTPLKITMPTV